MKIIMMIICRMIKETDDREQQINENSEQDKYDAAN